MKERFAETELEGSKELKENAENKKTKKAENPVLEGKARFYASKPTQVLFVDAYVFNVPPMYTVSPNNYNFTVF